MQITETKDIKVDVQWNGAFETHEKNGIPSEKENYFDTHSDKVYTAKFDGTKKGVVATATWSNFKNSYYYDYNTGKNIPIGSIKVVMSDLTADGANGGKPVVFIYQDINMFTASLGASGLTQQIYFYDNNGNELQLDDNSSWLGISSLGSWSGKQLEHVKALNNATFYSPAEEVTIGDQTGIPATITGNDAYNGTTKDGYRAATVLAKINNGVTLRYEKNALETLSDEVKNTEYVWKTVNGVTDWFSPRNTLPYYNSPFIDGMDLKKLESLGIHNDRVYYQWGFSVDLDGFAKPETKIEPPKLDAKLTNVALQQPTTSYHFDKVSAIPVTPQPTQVDYHYNQLSVPVPNPTKVADGEGKMLLGGDTSTQHISQSTGVGQNLDKFVVGDAIQYTNDGRLPVSYDLSKWTVTDSAGNNVTGQGSFTEYDLNADGHKYHAVVWKPKSVSTLKDNETYTLNTVVKTIDDKITDGEYDRPLGGADGKTLGEAHHYPEYNQTTDKHWMEGNRITDNKVYINGDTAEATVTMSLPDPDKLVNKLNHVEVIDDFTQFKQYVDYKSAQVLENGRDVTGQYNISVKDGIVSAVRKDATTTPTGNVELNTQFKLHNDIPQGVRLQNLGKGRLNITEIPSKTVEIIPFKHVTDKNWVDGENVVNDKTYVDGDMVHAKVDTTFPEPSSLANPLTKTEIDEDFSKFAQYIDYKSAQVLENGKDVTSQYNIVVKNGHVTATRKNAAQTPSGAASLLVDFKIHGDVPNGIVFLNNGSATLNQNKVPTPERKLIPFHNDTDKHWVEGSQIVDDKTYIAGDDVHAQVTMSLPDPTQLVHKLSNVSIDDDFTQYAKLVDYKSAQVLENGKDVTSQYNIVVKNGHVTATRKNPGAAPKGTVTLAPTFTVHADVPSGTKLINSGSGTLNTNVVPTPKRTITTYKQTTDKHWVEGSQNVDGKIEINDDVVTSQITMSLPNPATLAKKLSTVQLVDDYTNFAKYVAYQNASVLENGKDVSSEYTITNDAKGYVIATRKDASSTPNGSAKIVVNFKINHDVPSGTKLINRGSGKINNEIVPVPEVPVVTYTPQTEKHWVEGSQVVDGKIAIDGDTATGKVSMTLPEPSKLAKTLSYVSLTDDYRDFAKYVTYKSAQVLENGKDATAQYNISVKDAMVVAVRKDSKTTPAGNADLIVAWTINHDTPRGTKLINKGAGRLNNNEVPTNTPSITTYKPETNKHWVEGSQVVDGKVYIDEDKVTGEVTMTLPDQATLIKPLSNVTITDDYGKFAQYVTYNSAQVLENGKDVTSEYTLTNKDNKVIAVRKNASKAPKGTVAIRANFTIKKGVKSGTQLINSGSGTLNTDTVPTPDRIITTYTPKDSEQKHWVLNGEVTDNKLYLAGDKATAEMSVDLPTPDKLAALLKTLVIDDDFTKFADKVTVSAADVKVFEGAKDSTSEYAIAIKNGHVIATRKDASKNPGGKAKMVTTFTINNDVTNATILANNGSITVNNTTESVPEVPIVVWNPSAHKDVELGDDVKGDTPNSIDGAKILNGEVITYPLTISQVPALRAEEITKRVIVDELDPNAKFEGFKAWLPDEKGNLQDVTSQIKFVQQGQKLTFTYGEQLLARYKDKNVSPTEPIIDLVVSVHGDAKTIDNDFTVYTNDNVTESNKVTNSTPEKPTPTKVNLNEQGVNIDGKTVLPGSVNYYQLDWDLDSYKDLKASAKNIAKGFYYVDDFPEEAVDFNPASAVFRDANGSPIPGMKATIYSSILEAPAQLRTSLAENGISPKGAFAVFAPENVQDFYDNYVVKGKKITINAPMTVKKAFSGKYENKAYEIDFGRAIETDTVVNNVPKINPHKDIVLSIDNQASLNGKVIKLGQVFDYKLEGPVLPANEGHDIFQYEIHDDYDEEHDQYNGQYTVLTSVDVTLKDGTILKKGTDITKYFKQTIDTAKGDVTYAADKEFLDSIDFSKNGFGANIYMNMKRIKAGIVKNIFDATVNGVKYDANEVVSTTPEPEKPKADKPQPTPVATPKTPAKPVVAAVTTPELPQTGESDETAAELLGLATILAGLGAASFAKKKREDA